MQDICLGRKIYSHQWPALKRRGGGHIQDASPATLDLGSLDHGGKIQAREVRERGHGELNLAQAFFQIILDKQAILSESCVVDQDLDLNIGALGLIQYIGGSSRFGEISGEDQRTRAVCFFKFGCESSQCVRASGDENQVVTFPREDAGEF